MDETIQRRLDELREADPESAEQIGEQLCRISTRRASRSSPERIAATAKWLRENIAPDEVDVVVAPGFGTGLDLATLMEGIPETCRVFWMEHDPLRAAEIFQDLPFERHVAAGRLGIAIGDDRARTERKFMRMWSLPQAPKFKIFYQERNTPEAEKYYTEALRSVCKSVILDIFNLGTLICRGALWQFNTIKNLPRLVRNPGINALKMAFQGKPALVVGAGPSLNAALPYLARCSKGFVTISVGTALRALRQAGIKPDLVAAVDAHPLTAAQFNAQCDDLYLACSTLVYPPAIAKFKGLFSGTLDANPIDKWLDELTEPRGALLAAGTVTSSAIDLAIKMGCNPVVSVGFDLSLGNDGTTHAANTMYHGVKLRPDYHELVHVPGNHQPSVVTTHQFRNYISLLEQYIESRPETEFVNVTSAGAKIKGTRLAAPAQLPDFAAADFDASGIIERIHSAFVADSEAVVLEGLKKALSGLDPVIERASHAAGVCNQLILALRSPGCADSGEVGAHLDELEEIDKEILGAQESSFLLEMSLWPARYWLATRKSEHERSYSDAVFSNKRWRQFYEQIAGAAAWTRDLLAGVVGQIEASASRGAAQTRRFLGPDNREDGAKHGLEKEEFSEMRELKSA